MTDREEMYRKQEEANEIRFRNLEDLIQKGHETILLESNRIVTEIFRRDLPEATVLSSWEEMRSDCQSWILMNLTL